MKTLWLHRLLFGAGIGLAACTSPTSGSNDDGMGRAPGFDRNALLEDMADQVIIPAVKDFDGEAGSLMAAVEAWSNEPADGQLREAAQQAWLSTSLSWQRMEVLQVGPAGGAGGPSAGGRTGGQSLREEIYSGPFANPCRADQKLVDRGYAQSDFFETSTVNAYGLDILEYLLFVDDGATRCSSFAIDLDKWDSLPDEDLQARRAEYAALVASRVSGDALRLDQAWASFRDDFVNAGRPGSAFDSAQDAIDEVFAALYYVDLVVKDDKVGTPAALNSRCLEDDCLEQSESQFAEASRVFVHANLESAREMFTAGQGVGFDDYLEAAGSPELAGTLLTQLDEAVAAARGFDFSIQTGIRAGRDSEEFQKVAELHAAVSAFSNTLRAQFVSVLALEIPQEGAADND